MDTLTHSMDIQKSWHFQAFHVAKISALSNISRFKNLSNEPGVGGSAVVGSAVVGSAVVGSAVVGSAVDGAAVVGSVVADHHKSLKNRCIF